MIKLRIGAADEGRGASTDAFVLINELHARQIAHSHRGGLDRCLAMSLSAQVSLLHAGKLERKREDSHDVFILMRQMIGEELTMWVNSIID